MTLDVSITKAVYLVYTAKAVSLVYFHFMREKKIKMPLSKWARATGINWRCLKSSWARCLWDAMARNLVMRGTDTKLGFWSVTLNNVSVIYQTKRHTLFCLEGLCHAATPRGPCPSSG